jgi:glycosyltransferase involved in cell wall biosynthesis
MVRLVRAHGFDLVHVHGLVAASYCMLARRVFGMRIPLIYQQHGFHHHNYGRGTIGLRKLAERVVARQADRVIASTSSDVALLIAGGYARREQIVLLRNGVPEPTPTPEESARARAAIPRAGHAPIVGMVARIHPQKGIDTFLHAAARLRAVAPDTRFALVGSGEIEPEMRALSHALGLDDVLVWTGTLPARGCYPLFDVALMTSRWEGLPGTLVEYMAARRPIVLTAFPGVEEIVAPGEAEIVPADDTAAIADAVLRLLRDPALRTRRAEAARRRYETSYTLEAITPHYRALFREVLAR